MQTPRCACWNAYQPSPASRLPQKRSGAGRRCTCGSWLASDTDASLCLQERVAAIAGKPAPTGGGVAQGVGALVRAGLPAMQTPGCACRNAYQPSPASRLPQGRSGAGRRCTCGSWLASDAGDPLCLQERVSAIAGKPAPTEAEWCRVWVHLWELACQRCRRPFVSAGTRINHRRQASAHRGGVAQGVGALVGAGLPAMQTPRCVCRNA